MQIPIDPRGLVLFPGLLEEIEFPQGFALRLDWDRFVATGGVDRNMAQPILHNRDVDVDLFDRLAAESRLRLCRALYFSGREAGSGSVQQEDAKLFGE
jgi:hypothetical protein